MRKPDAHERERRRRSVLQAVDEKRSISWLASEWGVSRSAAMLYVQSHFPDFRRDLAENGRTGQALNMCCPIADRLAIVQFGLDRRWTKARIARVLNITPIALHMWLAKHAPEGLTDALELYSEEAA